MAINKRSSRPTGDQDEDEETHNICHDLFRKLSNNVKDADHEIWQYFNKKKFAIDRGFIEKISNENQRELLSNLLDNESEEQISKLLENASLFDEEFWLKLILATRDKACKPVDRGKTSRVRLQGHKDHEVTLEDLERKLLEDLPDLFQSQLCVPEVITFEQDKNDLVRNLKQQYDEINKSTDKKQRKERIEELKRSHQAQCFQSHVAAEAEAVVQTKIYEAARREKVPMVVLRGIKSAEHIGRHLERFGITLTKLKSLLSPEREKIKEKSDEVEHDVLVLAYHNNTVYVTFVQVEITLNIFTQYLYLIYQVKTSEYSTPWEPNEEDQRISK